MSGAFSNDVLSASDWPLWNIIAKAIAGLTPLSSLSWCRTPAAAGFRL
jgi:hypothetical protein